MDKLPLDLSIGGPGDGASGWLERNGSRVQLMLASPGKGYSEEPLVQVLDSDKQTVLLALDQRWILESGLFAHLNGHGSFKRFCNHRAPQTPWN